VGGLLLGTLLNLAGPWIIAHTIDVEFASGDRAGVIRMGGIYLGVLGATLVVSYLSRIVLEKVAQRAMVDLKDKLFAHLVDHDLSFHDKHSSGRLITRVQGDAEALKVLFSEVVLSLPADICLIAGMFVIMGISAPQVAPLVFMVIPPYVVLFILYRRVAAPKYLAARREKAALTGFLTEHIRSLPTLQLFGRSPWSMEQCELQNERVFSTELTARMQAIWYYNCIDLTRTLGIVLLLFVGAGQVEDGTLSIGALVMGLGYMRQMFNPLMRLSHQLATIERARAAAIRVAGILSRERQIRSPENPTPWPGLRDAIRLEQVGFSYVEDTPVLQDIDLEIPAGQHVGIVGSTGAGKSTVLNLLMRFRDPVHGAIRIDGIDLRELSLETLRQRFGLVLQDVHLFPGTILENLGGDAEAARRALDVLNLQDFKLDKELNEGGRNLSRGERQLLTFARALIGNPEVLVLDEATSAVDPHTEARVQTALDQLQKGRTTITVAHRLSTVRRCDRIYVLAHGRVVESGTHDALIEQEGVYAALSRVQQGVVA
jgi:ATP-binding cassette subfamily B protein